MAQRPRTDGAWANTCASARVHRLRRQLSPDRSASGRAASCHARPARAWRLVSGRSDGPVRACRRYRRSGASFGPERNGFDRPFYGGACRSDTGRRGHAAQRAYPDLGQFAAFRTGLDPDRKPIRRPATTFDGRSSVSRRVVCLRSPRAAPISRPSARRLHQRAFARCCQLSGSFGCGRFALFGARSIPSGTGCFRRNGPDFLCRS